MVPFITNHSIGQDYQTVSIQYQMELLFSIKTGSFPLYVPGFALGQSSSALTLGQVFHPLAHIASILPGYWEGKALEWNTFLRLLSLGLTHFVLFLFLKKLKIHTPYSFLISGITVYNLRMLDLFRYGASLEAYTAHLLLCTIIGFSFIDQSKKFIPIAIIGTTYLLVCSGHPQMMYYGVLGAGLFALIVPFFVSTMLPDIQINARVVLLFWGKIGLYFSLGLLLSSAYILPFYFDFITANTGRIGQDYAWADSYGDTFIGTLNSFLLPFRSDVHGNFGGSSLIIIAVLLPLLRFFKVRIPRSMWVTWGVLLLVFLHMQGGRTPVHHLAWEYLPFASSFRIAGRISLIMPILIMVILSWMAKDRSITVHLKGRSYQLSLFSLLALASVFLMILYYLLIAITLFSHSTALTDFAHFTPVTIRKIPRLVEISVILSGITSLLILLFYDSRQHAAKVLSIFLCVVTLIQVGTVLKYGTWVTETHDKPTFEQMKEQKKVNLNYRYNPGSGMYSSIVRTQLDNSFIEPFLGKIFTEVIPVSSQDDAYSKMRQQRSPQQIFIESYKPVDSASFTAKEVDLKKSNVRLIYNSFNRLQFQIYSPVPAFFGLSYPFTGHWSASINGNNVPVYRANGSAHAVPVPEGESIVEFRYWSSAAFWGMVLSCLTFVLVGFFFSLRKAGGFLKILLCVFVLFIGAGGFLLWYHSLYTSGNLETQYTWDYAPPPPVPNLAYGKKTWVDNPLVGGFLHIHSSRAIDGFNALNSGFFTGNLNDPFWTVDLHRIEKIKSIVLYEGTHDSSTNRRPLNIAFSEDSSQWRTVYSVISQANPNIPTTISFETPESAHYIQIQASGSSNLRLDEVEVYSAKETL
jgi:hypothetical protein